MRLLGQPVIVGKNQKLLRLTLIILDEVLHSPIVISELKDKPKAAKYIICFVACLFWPIKAYQVYKKRNRHVNITVRRSRQSGKVRFFRIFWYLPIRTIHEFCF